MKHDCSEWYNICTPKWVALAHVEVIITRVRFSMSKRTWHYHLRLSPKWSIRAQTKWSIIRLFFHPFAIFVVNYPTRSKLHSIIQLLKFYRNIIIIIEENFHYYKSISILINFFPFVKNSNKIRNDISTGEISFPNSVNRSKKQGIPIPSNAATIRLHPWNSLHKIRTDKRMQPPVYRSPTHAAPFHKRAGVWTGWRGRERGVGDGEQWAPRYRKGRRKLQPLA